MTESVISRKYAKALLEAAREQNQVENLLDENLELTSSLNVSQAADFLMNPAVPDKKKSELLDQIAEKASKLLSNYLRTIAKNGRYSLLIDSLDAFKMMANKELGRDEVEIVTAVALSDKQKQKMIEVIKAKFELNNVTIQNRVDESILGGFIIHNNVKVLDASIKSQLAKIATEL
ncbi:MAG: F0F1 ATP synthase subunit delta [Streptococcaceae bacterium]|jgi:F-type H+-transporting ATPase subunit delta|nr:F0F1 ATP synthase subunit delta [Streptococcaceae bacterium]